MANKLVPEKGADGKETGKYVTEPAQFVDFINPTVPLDAAGSLIRAAGILGVTLLLTR